MENKACVIGAGLSGSLMAVLIAKLGITVDVFEKRSYTKTNHSDTSEKNCTSEFGSSASAVKRSINLALSYRGILGLQEVGILEKVLENAIKMPRRVIHSIDKPEIEQFYGTKGDTLWSISRNTINQLLLELMLDNERIKVYFDHSLVHSDKEGNCTFQSQSSTFSRSYDLVIGADGAYSSVRDSLLRQGRINFSRQYIAHGYKELSIPPRVTVRSPSSSEGQGAQTQLEYALERVEGLHIWPRGDFMLIALPNPDKSFTATLFAPYSGRDGFDSIDPQDPSAVLAYFQRHFPDVVPLMPDLARDYRVNPVGSLVTIRTDPWYFGSTVLIGDAAHAVVPFYGQGMNAAFEDCYILYHILKKYIGSEGQQGLGEGMGRRDLFLASIKEFASKRTPAANGLADLCLEHYHDMASNTNSSLYLLRRKLENAIGGLFPSIFKPLYSMVAFSSIPYHEAIERAKRQDRYLTALVYLLGGSILISSAWLVRRVQPFHLLNK